MAKNKFLTGINKKIGKSRCPYSRGGVHAQYQKLLIFITNDTQIDSNRTCELKKNCPDHRSVIFIACCTRRSFRISTIGFFSGAQFVTHEKRFAYDVGRGIRIMFDVLTSVEIGRIMLSNNGRYFRRANPARPVCRKLKSP